MEKSIASVFAHVFINARARKAHFSTLICSGQMTRDEALAELQKPPYESVEQYVSDRAVFLRKLGSTESAFEDYLNQPITPNSAYANDTWLYNILRPLYS